MLVEEQSTTVMKGQRPLLKRNKTLFDMKKKFSILILEDDSYYNHILKRYVTSLCNEKNYPGIYFDIRSFKSAKECMDNLEPETDILILDYFLDEFDDFPYNGFDIMKAVKDTCQDCKVIVVSGQRSVTITTELFKKGIYDYIDKDYMPAKRLSSAVQRILNNAGISRHRWLLQ